MIERKQTRLVLAYKNFAANRNISHIGLGVAAINGAKVLQQSGIKAAVWPIVDAEDLRRRLVANPADSVIISAPWIPTLQLQALGNDFPDTLFSVNCHSNVGFLQADRNGVKLVRGVMELELGNANIRLSGNSRRFCDWIRFAFGAPCAYLPNLYFLNDLPLCVPRPFTGGTLRIGAFGATRPLKNMMSSAGAALEIARSLSAPLEFWVSAGRAEGGGEAILGAVKEMFANLPGVNLVCNGWQTWPNFRRTVGTMHLLLQPSYTESFNMVTADGIAQGVSSVVSSAIDWAPNDWKADVDDALEIARVGRRLLYDPTAAGDGRRALVAYVADGLNSYKHWLKTR